MDESYAYIVEFQTTSNRTFNTIEEAREFMHQVKSWSNPILYIRPK